MVPGAAGQSLPRDDVVKLLVEMLNFIPCFFDVSTGAPGGIVVLPAEVHAVHVQCVISLGL
jgi:hypothetical protein